MNADAQKSLATRPRVLRQRSQSAVTKVSPLADALTAADSDASKKSSVKHRHAHSHHHIPHHPKRFAKDFLGLQNGHSFTELSKQSSRVSVAPEQVASTGNKELNDSRKGSIAGNNVDGTVVLTVDNGISGEEAERLFLQEYWKNKARESELKSTLHNLSEESLKTTRRLDDLYYDLLERVANLQSTISNLQELSNLTAQLHKQFRKETDELTSDLQKQIDGFEGFKTQQRTIDTLDTRVRESKRKADKLSERLEAAREKVSVLEVQEKEWQDSVNWRLRWMYIILGTVVGTILAVCSLPYMGYGLGDAIKHPSVENQGNLAAKSLESLTTVPTSVKSMIEDAIGTQINTRAGPVTFDALKGSNNTALLSRTSKPPESTSPAKQDALLRIFDEL
ncbi:uncharacterized protein PV09_01572 [Verruconis gallopava]|uniref:Uncharacterized protein n=1 Tax=Verruconis gallopava TaxID=253628 RepID=A0A0D2AMD2_9PEZI|nr:uncharacterized protein PV09_01572 [Verruconis gallopava]KIW07625.1 hypothetical protein PV09_01572 [Verruconis gallopava]